jgi:magnesium-protoporphyrin O-methyltransferase
MSACCNAGLELQFDAGHAEQQLAGFRRNGPPKETRLLIAALRDAGVRDATVLDIGGGIGAVQDGLLREGARSVLSIDGSTAYRRAAEALAEERGYRDRVEYRVGDFVALAEGVPGADVVTLDKVICCYPDMERLVTRSADRTRRLWGAVYPRDTRLARVITRLQNAIRKLRRSEFRTFVHPESAIEAVLRGRRLHMRATARTPIWKVAVFARQEDAGNGCERA